MSRFNNILLFFSISVFLNINTLTSAQGFHWKKVGDFYYTFYSNVNAIGAIFVSGPNWFSRSTDGGETWEPITGIPVSISRIAFHDNGDIYVTALNNGSIYKSSDNGETWFDTEAVNNSFRAIIVSNEGNIYAGTVDGTFYISTDEGESWHYYNASPSQINSITSSSDSQIYIGTSSHGIYTSSDFGENWFQLSDNNIDPNTNSLIVNDNDYIFATHSDGIIISTDLGLTWELHTYVGASVQNILIVDSVGNIYSAYNNVYKSEDGSENWINIGGPVEINSVSIFQDKIYVGAERGLYSSDPDIIPYYGENFLPLQVGNIWQFLSYVYVDYGTRYNSIEYITVMTDTIMMGKKYYGYNSNSNWVRYDNEENIFYKLVNGSDRIIMNFNLFPVSVFWQFSNQAEIIQENRNILGNDIFNKGYQLSYVYPATLKQYFAENFGSTKYSYSDNYGGGTLSEGVIMATLFDSLGTQTNYTAHEKPEFSITPITVVNSPDFSLEFTIDHAYSTFYDPYFSGNIGLNFVDSVWMFSYYSNGDSTINLPEIIPYNYPNWINPDYSVNTTLDTSLLKNGFNFYYKFLAKDKGLIPENAASPDSGFYECVWGDPVGVNEEEELFSYKLAQNHPNPFNPVTTIRYSLGKGQIVKIDVMDILGRELITLVNEYKPRGNYSIKFDASELVSGIYFYRIQSGSFINVKKMVLIK